MAQNRAIEVKSRLLVAEWARALGPWRMGLSNVSQGPTARAVRLTRGDHDRPRPRNGVRGEFLTSLRNFKRDHPGAYSPPSVPTNKPARVAASDSPAFPAVMSRRPAIQRWR